MKYLLFLSILMMFLIGFSINVYAEDSFSMASAFGVKELKSLELFVNASDSLTANTNLTTYYFINSSDFTDGISKIVNVKLRIVIDKISAQPYMMNMYVNGSACLYSGFDTSLGVGQYVMYFDCTNRFLNQTDVMYRFDFNADRNAGNVFVLFMPTYVNNPDFGSINYMEDQIDQIYIKTVLGQNLVSNHDYCSDNSTSRKELTFFVGNSTLNTTTTRMIDTKCPYGCDIKTGFCNPSPSESSFYVGGFIIGCFALVCIVIWKFAR